jgi:hypothetical protein
MRIDMISTFKERADYHLITKNLKEKNPVKTKVSFIVGVVDKETVRMNLHFLRHEDMTNNTNDETDFSFHRVLFFQILSDEVIVSTLFKGRNHVNTHSGS